MCAPVPIFGQPKRESKIATIKNASGQQGETVPGDRVDWPPMIHDQLIVAVVAIAIGFIAMTEVMLALM